MSKRIHIPSSLYWLNFSSNSAYVDGYSISNNELSRCRASPHLRPLGYALTESCNKIWGFAYEEKPSILDLMNEINGILASGTEKDSWKPSKKSVIHTEQDKSKIKENIETWALNFKTLDQEAEGFLSRGFSPADLQEGLANFAWLSQYWISYWNSFSSIDGICGRFVTNAVRLRWSMPLWECDLDIGIWKENEAMYHLFWQKNGCFKEIPKNMVPNLKKYDLIAKSNG